MTARFSLPTICVAIAALIVPAIANANSISVHASEPDLPGPDEWQWRCPHEDMPKASFSLPPGHAVLRADISEQHDGWQYGGGVGYFRVGPKTGEFEVAVTAPFDEVNESFIAMISTPAGSLTFSLGEGKPGIYSGCNMFEFSKFLPPPPHSCFECMVQTTGIHHTGSFALPTDIRAELFAGRGELRLFSQSGTFLSGMMDVVLGPQTDNGNGVFDAADYVALRKGVHSPYDYTKYKVWRNLFGQPSNAVPEPANLALILIGTLAVASRRRNRSANQPFAT